MHDRLLIMTRYPHAGSSKTRLIPALGPDGAAELHRALTERTIEVVRDLERRVPVGIEVHHAGGTSGEMVEWLGPDLEYHAQHGDDLGRRLIHAIIHPSAPSPVRTVVIGTDCPGLDAQGLCQAFAALAHHDLVLGPARDGGYYLIGLGHDGVRRAVPQLFEGIVWGGDRVFAETLSTATRLGLTVETLPELSDVDRPEDLELLTGVGVFPSRRCGTTPRRP